MAAAAPAKVVSAFGALEPGLKHSKVDIELPPLGALFHAFFMLENQSFVSDAHHLADDWRDSQALSAVPLYAALQFFHLRNQAHANANGQSLKMAYNTVAVRM